jgi:RHS repeat-associated protein
MPAINEKTDVTNTYVWNAESEIKTGAGVNYTYDGDGDRVQKSSGKIYWYGAGTEVLDESDSAGNISDEYVFLGGRRVAHRVVSGNSIYYYGEDFLGTSRLIATAAGSVCYEADFYPFGGERDITSTCTPTYKFEGKERDTETNNDDFGARYYSSQFGRWTSPDWSSMPAPVPHANLTNPQTLNLYAMVSDNPESFADLDGHLGGIGEPVVLPNLYGLQGEPSELGTILNNFYDNLINEPRTCYCDDYKVDKFGHGSPHIDRTDSHDKLVGRYDENGNPIDFKGKTPGRIPRRDKEKFQKAADKLKEFKDRVAAANKPAQNQPATKSLNIGPYLVPTPSFVPTPLPSVAPEPVPVELPFFEFIPI